MKTYLLLGSSLLLASSLFFGQLNSLSLPSTIGGATTITVASDMQVASSAESAAVVGLLVTVIRAATRLIDTRIEVRPPSKAEARLTVEQKLRMLDGDAS